MTPPGTMPIPEGSVIITPGAMFDEVRRTTDAVRDLSNKLDPHLATSIDHEVRIRAIERRMWVAVGGSSAVAAGLATALSHIGQVAR